MIHDAVLDYYGRRLATCSSDRTIKIFELEGDQQRLLETLKGHEGAVWCVSWAHPKYGNILASAGYDGKVIIWREGAPASQQSQQAAHQQQQPSSSGAWSRIYDFALHKASVNTVSWSPHEAGCLLACASSDGCVSVLEFKENSTSASPFEHTIFPAHGLGVNAVSWAPAAAPGSIVSSSPGPQAAGNRRFVTGGCDNTLKIWVYDPSTNGYKLERDPLTGHTDWVRDVAWSPTVLQKSYIASAGQDKTVRIWTSESATSFDWACKTLNFEAVVWRVSWSLSGNVLAVSSQDNKVTLWKENLRGEWECVKTMEE
ncbi:WD domain-containing protein [Coniochaeta sp. 2T2.1]|nr:WD domain-containing protein [Coniochaeta sp. 2T2.1]